MNIWLVTREYAGIAEAGGVKNVACSLSENLVKCGHSVTVFMPLYGCSDISAIADFSCVWHKPVTVLVQNKRYIVSFTHGTLNGVNLVFITNKAFSQKKGVYTYTPEEESADNSCTRGTGHKDAQFLNSLFQQAVAFYGETCSETEKPDIIHSQDATAALVPAFIGQKIEESEVYKNFYEKTKFVVTIHNAGPGYHHEFYSVEEAFSYTNLKIENLKKALNNNTVEPFLLAAQNSCITTVSPEYAQEISAEKIDTAGLSVRFNQFGTKIIGITNGIDFSKYEPSNPKASLLPFAFNPEKNDFLGKQKCLDYLINEYASTENEKCKNLKSITKYGNLCKENYDSYIYITYHGRLVTQKGISVLARAAEKLLSNNAPVRFIFIGQGQANFEEEFASLSKKYDSKCVFFRGYDRFLSRLCMASADFAVFPSFFEPCGLEDFIAQIYGTIPVAHATGGLQKIINAETGFLYKSNNFEELYALLSSLIKIQLHTKRNFFHTMISYAANYVRKNYSWDIVVKEKYIPLYKSLVQSTSDSKSV